MTDFLPKFKIREESVTFTTYFWKSSIDFHYWFLSNSTVFIQYLIRSSVMHFKMQLKYKIHSRMRYTMGRYIHPPQYHNCHLLTSLCYQTKQIMSATLDSTWASRSKSSRWKPVCTTQKKLFSTIFLSPRRLARDCSQTGRIFDTVQR